MVGHDNRLFETHAAQLVQCDAYQLERAGDQTQCRFGITLKLAVDFRGAQHQQVDRFRNRRFATHEIVEQHFREAIPVTLGQHIHALRDVAHGRPSELGHECVVLQRQSQTRACARQQTRGG